MIRKQKIPAVLIAVFTALMSGAPASGQQTDAGSFPGQKEKAPGADQVTGATPARRWTVTGRAQKPAGPAWADQAVFYQIYPQTFYDSDGDGVGDLEGIIRKIGYVKSLGAGAVWLNPFYESPFRDAGYDASDFYKVAPRYGTNDDARRLFDEFHRKGLRVIVDYVPSYTSIDHPWFKASCDPKPNRHSNWYVWTASTWFPGMEQYRRASYRGIASATACS